MYVRVDGLPTYPPSDPTPPPQHTHPSIHTQHPPRKPPKTNQVKGTKRHHDSVAAFVEEGVVRRELSDNFCCAFAFARSCERVCVCVGCW